MHSPGFIPNPACSDWPGAGPGPMACARFERMFDDLVASTAGTHGASAVQGWARVENAACARRLAAMVAMLEEAYAADGSAAREQWCLDNWDAVSAHIGAAQHLTSGTASGLLLIAVALHDRLPKVAAVFADGLIDYRTVRTLVTRSLLVLDPDARRRLDSALREGLGSWGPMSQHRLEQYVDALIEQIDPQRGAPHPHHEPAHARWTCTSRTAPGWPPC